MERKNMGSPQNCFRLDRLSPVERPDKQFIYQATGLVERNVCFWDIQYSNICLNNMNKSRKPWKYLSKLFYLNHFAQISDSSQNLHLSMFENSSPAVRVCAD